MKCELCQTHLHLSDGYFAYFDGRSQRNFKGWYFACVNCPDAGYDIKVSKFFQSPTETINWLAHIAEKSWFDGNEFCDFMWRLRAWLNEGEGNGISD